MGRAWCWQDYGFKSDKLTGKIYLECTNAPVFAFDKVSDKCIDVKSLKNVLVDMRFCLLILSFGLKIQIYLLSSCALIVVFRRGKDLRGFNDISFFSLISLTLRIK